MYQAPDKQIFPYAEKVLLSLKAAWREDKSKFPFLKEYDAVSLLCPNPSDDWKDCHQTFQTGRLPATVARDLFRESLPLILAKYLKEEFEARSDLANTLSTQAMAEYGVHHMKAIKVSKSDLPDAEAVKTVTEAKSDAYDILRLISKQHGLAFAKALFRFGEARKAL